MRTVRQLFSLEGKCAVVTGGSRGLGLQMAEALINFTRILADEWGWHGIAVNAIAPGFFPSKMTKGILAAGGAEVLARQAPLLGRLGDEDDLKGALLLFASDAGKHITGQVLAVDGGLSAV